MNHEVTVFQLLATRCPHCGKAVGQCDLVWPNDKSEPEPEIFTESEPVCEACYEAHDGEYWRSWNKAEMAK